MRRVLPRARLPRGGLRRSARPRGTAPPAETAETAETAATPETDDTTVALALQAASVLLSYPDPDALALVVAATSDHQPGSGTGRPAPLDRLAAFANWWSSLDPMEREMRYVATFDHRGRCSLHLTYYRDGDTRNRGESLLELHQLYRSHGVEPPRGELADFLPALLELAATTDAGPEVLHAHRKAIELLGRSLDDLANPFAEVVGTVSEIIATVAGDGVWGDEEEADLRRLAREGPPSEQVGLEVPVSLTARPGGTL